MIVTIDNGLLSLAVDTRGAQMRSLKRNGTEYLWQGDPRYWDAQAPILFPFIARLTGNSYTYKGTLYPMTIHGFAASSEFTLAEQRDAALVLELKSSEVTLAQYPFDFTFRVIFTLKGDTLETAYHVENRTDQTMPFGIGGHPGFKVPVGENEKFEDYYLEFSQECQPDRVGFTPQVYLSGHDARYPLAENKRLPLSHSLFDEDAIVLYDIPREVTLEAKNGGRSLKVSFPDMPYLGIWHWPKTDAPYVCIEPWHGLGDLKENNVPFEERVGTMKLEPNKEYRTSYYFRVY